MISGKSPIDMSSLVTRIARYIGVKDNAEVTFMPETEAFRYEVGLEHFVPGNSIFMCYPGYDREIELPLPRLCLYVVKSLTLQMEKKEPARRSIAGPQTRKQNRAGPTSRSRTITSSTPGPHYCSAWTFYSEHELR